MSLRCARIDGNHRLVKNAVVAFMLVHTIVPAMGAPRTYTGADVPKDIPDPGEIISKIRVPESFTIRDVDVKLTIQHSWNTDIDAYLIHNGCCVELFTDVAGQVDDFVDTVLSDEAIGSILNADPPCTGTFRPEGHLRDFDLGDAHGDWELRIVDDFPGDKGRLVSWSLTLEPCISPAAPTHPSPADEERNVPVNPCLSWDAAATPETTWAVYFGTDPCNLSLVAGGLTATQFCLDTSLQQATEYHWTVIGSNPCGQTADIRTVQAWKFATAGVPLIRCHDVTVSADRECQVTLTAADIDDGSDDGTGGPVTLTLDPPGPYPIGQTVVTVKATAVHGAVATHRVKVTVLASAYCCKKAAIGLLESVLTRSTCNNRRLLEAVGYLRMSIGEGFDAEANRVVWAGANRVAQWQGGFRGPQVFEFDVRACELLLLYIADGGSAFQAEIEKAWELVAEAERLLTDTAIEDAAFQRVPPEVLAAARQARNEGNVAKARGGADILDVALKKYFQAWDVAVAGLGPPTDYNRDKVLDANDLLMFSEDLLSAM